MFLEFCEVASWILLPWLVWRGVELGDWAIREINREDGHG